MGFVWDESNNKHSLSMKGLYQSFQTLRAEYKAKPNGEGEAMQLTIKLLGNAKKP
jgi:hypothetical protein